MSYIGNPIVSTDFPVDYKSGNGSTTAFTLSIAPASVNSIDVQISGVSQSPQTYSVSGTTLTFSAAPPTGTNNIVVRHLGIAGVPNTPSAASVVTTSIADANVTQSKLAYGVAGTGPAFSAYMSSGQVLSSTTSTLLSFNTKTFDTATCFNNTGSTVTLNGISVPAYSFAPNVAGYYQISSTYAGAAPSAPGDISVTIRKNNDTVLSNGSYIGSSSYTVRPAISGLVYLNGTSDYVNVYAYVGSGQTTQSGSQVTSFAAVLVRSA